MQGSNARYKYGRPVLELRDTEMGDLMKALIGTAAFCLASCGQVEAFGSSQEDQMAEICGAYIQSQLRSPSSYKEIAVQHGERTVTIEYDAVNAFNAPLRDTETCSFPDEMFTNGGPKFDAVREDALNLASEELPCCDIVAIEERAAMEAQAFEDMNAGMENVGSGFDDWEKENGL